MKKIKLSELCTIEQGKAPVKPGENGKNKLFQNPGITLDRKSSKPTARVLKSPFMAMPRAICLTDFPSGVDLEAVAAQINANFLEIVKGSARPHITIQALSELEIELAGGDAPC